MTTPATELVFPPKLIPGLRDLRDKSWAELVDRIETLDPYHLERLGFELMIVRWSGCINCQADSFRAMQGCALCATQAVRRYRGDESDIRDMLDVTIQEIKEYLAKMS
jgi:hypothetical protein